jgi:hypothetical protein
MKEKKYYEPNVSKPLLQGMVIESAGNRYKTNRWFIGENHAYEFIFLGNQNETSGNDFYKKPSEVEKAMNENKIKIIFSPY